MLLAHSSSKYLFQILAMDLDYFLLKMKWEPELVADIRESLSLLHLCTMIGLEHFLGGLFCCCLSFLLSMTFPWPFSMTFPWPFSCLIMRFDHGTTTATIVMMSTRPKKTERDQYLALSSNKPLFQVGYIKSDARGSTESAHLLQP